MAPGAHNLGIFVTLKQRDNEEYQLTHPPAHLGGILRGSLSVTVSDVCYITCPRTKIKVILHYLEEGWIGRAQNKVVGVIFRYDPDKDDKTRIKDVPEKDILARIDGSWQDKVFYTLTPQQLKSTASKSSSAKPEPTLLIDVNPLFPIPKIVPPESAQATNESRRFWSAVTSAIHAKQFAHATTLKQNLEERQRTKAAERKEKGVEWKPRFFTGAVTPLGKPELTEEGRAVLLRLDEKDYAIEEAAETGA